MPLGQGILFILDVTVVKLTTWLRKGDMLVRAWAGSLHALGACTRTRHLCSKSAPSFERAQALLEEGASASTFADFLLSERVAHLELYVR